MSKKFKTNWKEHNLVVDFDQTKTFEIAATNNNLLYVLLAIRFLDVFEQAVHGLVNATQGVHASTWNLD